MKQPLIFVVDKNPIHRNLVRYHLEINKLTNVHTFPSGEECLFRIRKDLIPEYIVTGFHTGVLDGFGFLGNTLDISPKIRVVFFDAFEDHRVAAELIGAGACDCVAKTRNPDAGITELIKNVRYLVNNETLRPVF